MDKKRGIKYLSLIIIWAAIGLGLRLLLMPFTMHSQDLAFINYFPMKFVTEGMWDPYGYMAIMLKGISYPYAYYGPVVFIVTSLANFIFIKLFHITSLVTMLNTWGGFLFKEVSTSGFIAAFPGIKLYWNLFFLKAVYLIFDFSIGIVLLKMASSKKDAVFSFIIWMLNIAVLHTAYAIGQVDLIPAFFIIMALYCAVKNRPFISVVLLSLGAAAKLFPFLLILPACLILGNDWENRASLFFTGISVLFLCHLPFYIASGSSFLKYFVLAGSLQYKGIEGLILKSIFAALYLFMVINSIKDSRLPHREEKLFYYFLIILLLSFTTFPMRLRYFVSVTPLLALLIPHNKKFGIAAVFIVLIIAFLSLSDRSLQMGLFAPLGQRFLDMPAFQEVIGRYMNIELIYKFASRVLLVLFFAVSLRLWRIKSKNNSRVLIK